MREIILFLKTYPLYFGVFLTLIPIGILLSKGRQGGVAYQLLLACLVTKIASDLLMIYYAAKGMNNLWLHNLMVPIRYFLLSGMIYHFLETPHFKKWIRISWSLFLVFIASDIYLSNKQIIFTEEHRYVRYSGVVECVLMLLWILLYFYEIMQSLKIANLLKSPAFLISVAWLLHYAALVFFAPLFYYMYRSKLTLDLGILEIIPDCMEYLAVVIISVGVSFIPSPKYD